MKNRIFKMIIVLSISLFLSAGYALAHDKKGRQHKSHGKAYRYHGDHDRDDHHPNWHKKHRNSYRHKHRHHNRHHRYHYHRYWHGHHPGWKKWHHKSHHRRHEHKRRLHKRLDDWKLYDHYRHGRYPESNGFIFGMSFDDPYMSVVIDASGN